uniref:Telomere-associated protein Rif1 N-terminal domain-containing protein n=1 Tax=Kwoniella pini CBS 10737 TaxID=1296096 RepID=A0A1B9I7W4_9TREE|nr:uncharacterized protein I206_02387 [Kwoniella pini CBS 10737]OCF51672.1 hypothetical protein I206_02387 [Kwoniella pini CBS 10737]
MSIFSSPRSHVSFDTDVDTHIGSSSSALDQNEGIAASSSSPTKSGILPLGPSKTIPALNRRGVIFSPRTDTKYFHSDDLVLASPTSHSTPKPPTSIRSYSDPVTPYDSPSHSKAKQARILSDTPLLVRSILKSRLAQQIRLASTVEEGTLNNKEAARLLVSGKRPKLLARDSFQLALMRNAASDGSNGNGKGKGKMSDEIPSSDDSNGQATNIPVEGGNGVHESMLIDGENSEEEEETVEEDGALSTASLVNIILDGAEDLLTLEEAYSTLTLRLRTRISTETDTTEPPTPSYLDEIRISTQPIRDEAPAMVRAIQRDLQRLLGKLPTTDVGSSDSDLSPFRQLMPLRDTTPTNQRGRLTPSPTPGTSSSPTKSARQGYTEAEVRYRREASGVGAAVLRLLAFTFHTSHLFSCFSEADLTSLLDQVMMIPRTPKLPTPNPKRTYYLSIIILTQMNLPSTCVQPVKEKIVRAVEGAMGDTLGAMGGVNVSGKEGPSPVRKEGFNAVTNLLSNYPTILFPYYPDLLGPCLKGLSNGNNLMRYKAGSAISAFARAKFAILASAQDNLTTNPTNTTYRETYTRVKGLLLKSEYFVVSHLKGALKMPGKSTVIYGKDGEKKLEWHSLEQNFKDTVGSVSDVHWACAAWSVVVTLMGSAYASSGLASSFDHIMDRSLQPSTNVVRPLLARVAWNHAIHAYLATGFASSVSEDGRVVKSYKPFAASSQQSIEQRTANIQFPVNLALAKATDKASYARALTSAKQEPESHYIWQRSEKSKKLGWVITCGLGATAVVYAHTGMALYHEDQPAKEFSQITGMPSSDGVVPDTPPSAEEARLPRLDAAWENVVNPILRTFFNICGVDKLTTHAWQILESITLSPSPETSSWDLDRLLVPRYMSGEMFAKDKEPDFSELLLDVQEDELNTSDIPSWGHFWTAKRLGRLLILFDEALSSIHGINDQTPEIEWVRSTDDIPLLPATLSNIWKNLMLALKSAKIPSAPPTPLFLVGLQSVAQHLIGILNRDPKTYVPITRINEKGLCTLDEDQLKIGLFSHLFEVMLDVLGEDVLGSMRLRADASLSDQSQISTTSFVGAFGADANGNPTVCGTLLGQLLRLRVTPSSSQPPLQENLRNIVSRILNIGCVPGYAGKLLGDITNAMPFLFEDCEQIQLDIWRLLGALLVSLLSGPFRGRSIASYWHQAADLSDLEIWQSLLKVTVLRFRAKRFGSNCGVLEALAAHLEDFTSDTANEKTKSTTITLSCLASAISYMSFTPSDLGGGSHNNNSEWVISDEDFVPIDFLSFVISALIEAYPSTNEIASQDTTTKMEYSSAAFDLLENVISVLKDVPVHLVGKVLKPLHGGLVTWLEDQEGVVNGEDTQRLDNLYVPLLSILSDSIPSEDLPLNSATLNGLAELYIPRISKASSSAVPKAFQSFWDKTFAKSSSPLEYSDDLADFLRDLLSAVPGMIICPGLEGDSQISQEEGLNKFPHIQNTFAQPPAQIGEIDLQIEIEQSNPSYDADVSQSLEHSQLPDQINIQVEKDDAIVDIAQDDILVDATKDDILVEILETDVLVDATKDEITPPSPLPENPVEDEDDTAEDVFGPAALTKTVKSKVKRIVTKKTKAKGKGKGRKRSSIDSESEQSIEIHSLPEPEAKRSKIEFPTASHSLPDLAKSSIYGSDDDDNGSCIVVAPSPGFYKRKGLQMPNESTLEDADQVVLDTPENEIDSSGADGDQQEPEETQNVYVDPAAGMEDTQQVEDQKVISEEHHAEVQSRLVETPTIAVQSPSRPSMFKGWLSKVPSFPFFSPSNSNPSTPDVILPPATQAEPIEMHPVSPPAVAEDEESPAVPVQVAQNKNARNGRGRRGGKKRNAVNRSTSIAPTEQNSQEENKALEEQTAINIETEPVDSIPAGTLTRTRSKGKRKAAEIEPVSINQPDPEPIPELVEESEPRRSKRRRSKATVFSPEPTQPVTKAAPIADNPKSFEKDKSPAPIEIDEEDEDELLLSPESARRRKREEEDEIRASQIPPPTQQFIESISGRFDDAEGDLSIQPSLPTKPLLNRNHSSPSLKSRRAKSKSSSNSSLELPSKPFSSSSSSSITTSGKGKLSITSPIKRTTQQNNLIQMIDEAAKSRQVIDNLDYNGVKSLLKNLNTLREAAEERIITRMEEYRNAR